MKILHTALYYHPSVGGAQEVVRQLSERLVQRGHEVTVATTRIANRSAAQINGVKIEEFEIFGNAVKGIHGEKERFQNFILESEFDVMMNYAAQQWSMDLIFPIIDKIRYPKIMIPCGFSSLYDPAFHNYFRIMPEIMKKYDHLVFHANNYRDINFAQKFGMSHYSIIPNGAAKEEFLQPGLDFRKRYHISEEESLLLTVGSHTGSKGHRLCLDAFKKLNVDRATLIIVGNTLQRSSMWRSFFRPFIGAIVRLRISRAIQLTLQLLFGGIGPGCLPDCRMGSRRINFNRRNGKRVLLINPIREEVVAAFHAADLFVFGSNIEYSPLVLFEAMASRTPFISLACGNACEIADWGGGGIIAPTEMGTNGYVEGVPETFAEIIEELINNPVQRTRLVEAGHSAWLERFTWEKIVDEYEALYLMICEQDA